MKVLICGDRNYTSHTRIFNILGAFAPDTIIIHGGAQGADTIAGEVAETLGMEVHVYPADWATLGRRAGPVRNQVMLDSEHPDLVIAFHNFIDLSKGTKDMLTRAHAQGYHTHLRDNQGLKPWPIQLGR